MRIPSKRFTQQEVDRMIAPMELDLIAVFKLLEATILENLAFNDDMSPEHFINEITGLLGYADSGSVMVTKDTKYNIGDRKTRADGTVWEKTGVYSWKKVDGGDTTTKPDDKKDDVIDPKAMTAEQAKEIVDRIGKKGFWSLTKDGLNNWLKSHGVKDPEKMKYKDKSLLFDKLFDEDIEKDKEENTLKPKKLEPFSNINMKVRSSDGSAVSLQEYYNENNEELSKLTVPKKGYHWGASKSGNETAQAIALSSGTKWRPIDKIKDGNLVEHDQTVVDTVFTKAKELRDYAQNRIKQHSRDEVPSFFRGMTLDPEVWESIASGESDTIELTGCTAFSCYEAIADRYSKSSWTKGFGANKKSVKIVLERDDATDDSIGMWHEAFSSNKNDPKPAFELLSGLESIRILRVEGNKKVVDQKTTIKKNMPEFTRVATEEMDRRIERYKLNITRLTEDQEKYKRIAREPPTWMESRKKAYYEEIKDEEELKKEIADLTDEDMNIIMLASKQEDMFPHNSYNGSLFNYTEEAIRNGASTMREWFEGENGYSYVKPKFVDLLDYDVKKLKTISEIALRYHKNFKKKKSLNVIFGNTGKSQRLVLHCVAGRGKKSIVGSNEDLGDEGVSKALRRKYL